VAALLNGQIAAYVGGSGSGAALVKQYSQVTIRPIKPGEIGFTLPQVKAPTYEFVNCNNKNLSLAISAVLTKSRKSGEFQKQLAPWGLHQSEYRPPTGFPLQGC
jgi:ABC-type amino acid transport substrate-binding protein